MRIVLAASYRWQVYAPSFAAALSKLGVTVTKFEFDKFLASSLGRLELRLGIGPNLCALNRELLSLCMHEDPDVVLIWTGLGVWPQTVQQLAGRFWTTSYTNDDPFGPRGESWFWNHYRQSLIHYNSHHVYRDINIQEYEQRSFSPVAILRSYFVPSLHFAPSSFCSDPSFPITFIGHGEPYRTEVIKALSESGMNVFVFGPLQTWDKALFSLPGVHFFPGTLSGADYREVIWRSQICLGFLSRLNRDDYTRRYFEIPACGGFLMAERTTFARSLFEEGKEVEYFSEPKEAVAKCKAYLDNPDHISNIALAGCYRCTTSAYDVFSRAAKWLEDIQLFQATR